MASVYQLSACEAGRYRVRFQGESGCLSCLGLGPPTCQLSLGGAGVVIHHGAIVPQAHGSALTRKCVMSGENSSATFSGVPRDGVGAGHVYPHFDLRRSYTLETGGCLMEGSGPPVRVRG